MQEEQSVTARLKKASMNLESEDLNRADELAKRIGRHSNRTEVFRRAVHLLYWAFVKKEADELVIMKRGKELGRLEWADSLPSERSGSTSR